MSLHPTRRSSRLPSLLPDPQTTLVNFCSSTNYKDPSPRQGRDTTGIKCIDAPFRAHLGAGRRAGRTSEGEGSWWQGKRTSDYKSLESVPEGPVSLEHPSRAPRRRGSGFKDRWVRSLSPFTRNSELTQSQVELEPCAVGCEAETPCLAALADVSRLHRAVAARSLAEVGSRRTRRQGFSTPHGIDYRLRSHSHTRS